MHHRLQFLIQVSLSQGDFTSLMKVLNENLTEGQVPPAAPDGGKQLTETPSKQVETAITPSHSGKYRCV